MQATFPPRWLQRLALMPLPGLFVGPAVVQQDGTAFAHSVADVGDIVGGGDAVRRELDFFAGVEFESVVEQPHAVAEEDRRDV